MAESWKAGAAADSKEAPKGPSKDEAPAPLASSSVEDTKKTLEDKDDGDDDGSVDSKTGNAPTKKKNKKVVVKVGMVGDSQIGKTSLMVKYVEGNFNEDYIQTLGKQSHCCVFDIVV